MSKKDIRKVLESCLNETGVTVKRRRTSREGSINDENPNIMPTTSIEGENKPVIDGNDTNEIKKENESSSRIDANNVQDAIDKLNSKKKVISRETKLRFFEAVVGYLTSFPAKDFFTQVIKSELEESSKYNEMMFGALFKAIGESSKQSLGRSPVAEQFKKPLTYFDFTMCEDEQFQEMLHVTRKTARTIIEHIRGIPVDLDYNDESYDSGSTQNDPIDKILFLVLWYLRSYDNKLEEAVQMFELGSIEHALKVLNRGLKLLGQLKADAGLLWPTHDEFLMAAAFIERRFSFPDVAAVLGHKVIKCENGQRLMLQGVCNDKGMFIDICTSFDTRPRIIYRQSMLKVKFRDLRNGLSIVCEDFGIPEKSKTNMVLPYNEDTVDISTEEQLFNIMHEFVVRIIKDSFNRLLARFQRLDLLDRGDPEIVTVACILHNYCIKLNDLTPL